MQTYSHLLSYVQTYSHLLTYVHVHMCLHNFAKWSSFQIRETQQLDIG